MCPKIDIKLENKALRWSLFVIAICLSSRYIELYKQANTRTTKKTQKIANTVFRNRIVKKRIHSCIPCILSCGNTFVLHVSMCSSSMHICSYISVSWLPVFPCLRPIKVRRYLNRRTLRYEGNFSAWNFISHNEMRIDVIWEYWEYWILSVLMMAQRGR